MKDLRCKEEPFSTLLELRSRIGDKLLGIRVVCPRSETAGLKATAGLRGDSGISVVLVQSDRRGTTATALEHVRFMSKRNMYDALSEGKNNIKM